jgi:hypothetical protein
MPPRIQPLQQDLEEEDDALVTGKEFKEMMHMMESLTVSTNEMFDNTTMFMNEMFHKSQASTETHLSGCNVVLWLWLTESWPSRLSCQLRRLTQMLQQLTHMLMMIHSLKIPSAHWDVRDPDMSRLGAGHVQPSSLEPGLGTGQVRFRGLELG